jgi:predicted adenylyl cyclase CyaB
MQNVEIKCELRDPALARALCAALRVPLAETLKQTDTYFKLADGRLKRRESEGFPTEYIFYHRENAAKNRISRFKIYSVQEARTVFGMQEPPVWVVVKKVRDVYMHDGVRIHLDAVEGLGNFFELEALVTPQNNLAKSYAKVDFLRKHFGPSLGEPLSVSYCDMIAAEQAGG